MGFEWPALIIKSGSLFTMHKAFYFTEPYFINLQNAQLQSVGGIKATRSNSMEEIITMQKMIMSYMCSAVAASMCPMQCV